MENRTTKKRNYRSIGTYMIDRKGLAERRAEDAHTHSRSVPSIPPKYAVPALKIHSQPKAFNVSGRRFIAQDALVPGAGAYYRPPSLVKSEPSMSKKGYTSLASKSSRFDASSELELRSKPGPGTYFRDSSFSSSSSSSSPSSPNHRISPIKKTTPSAAFVKGKRSRCEEATNSAAIPIGPGVGKYDCGRSQLNLLPKAGDGGSALRWSSKRPPLNGNESDEIPEPGRYQIAQALDFLTKQGQQSNWPSSSFISKAPRGFLSSDNHVPSPGSYDVAQAEQALNRGHASKGRCKSAFHQGNQDRWGNPLHPTILKVESPGPGAFHHNNTDDNDHDNDVDPFYRYRRAAKKSTLTSAFRSASLRLSPSKGEAPGPAYYKPEEPNLHRKSFFFNHMKRWV